MQPDTIIPDQANPQSWNRYSYTLNNPIRYNDPDGHESKDPCGYYGVCQQTGLYLIGSAQDTQRVVDVINNNLSGFEVSITSEGRLTIKQTDNENSQTPSQNVMSQYLIKIINSNKRIEISVVSGDDYVIGDNFATSTLDIQDVEEFGDAPGVSSGGVIIHSFEEQYQKQVNGVTNYEDAHFNYAIPAEEAFAGAIREKDITDNQSFVTATYKYPDGGRFYTTVNPKPFTVTKHGDDPISRLCR